MDRFLVLADLSGSVTATRTAQVSRKRMNEIHQKAEVANGKRSIARDGCLGLARPVPVLSADPLPIQGARHSTEGDAPWAIHRPCEISS